jgi:diamine N-acetyltransferase
VEVTLIHLEPITAENYRECTSLKVANTQAHLVASNAKSLAEAYVFYASSRPYDIYCDDTMVGFILLRELEHLQSYYLSQFMIDEHHQRKGYGKQAMLVLIESLKEEKKYSQIDLCYLDGDEGAKNLYEGLGFVSTGEVEANEIIMRLRLTPLPPTIWSVATIL